MDIFYSTIMILAPHKHYLSDTQKCTELCNLKLVEF